MFLAASLFLVLLFILILVTRLKSQMAALVAWLVGSVTGGRSDDKNQERDKKAAAAAETDKLLSKKIKVKPKKSPTREPSFSTTLTTPIEEVIEETLKEEAKTATDEGKPSSRLKKRSKARAKPRGADDVDDLGSSGTKTKSAENISNKADVKKGEVSPDSPPPPADSAGISFLPVPDRRRKKNQKTKIDDLPKSTLIEHYEPKRNAKPTAPVEEFIVIERPQKPAKKAENVIEIVNKESGKTVYLEAKESKKVHAKISYASVASQRFDESLERLKEEEERLKKSEDSVTHFRGSTKETCALQSEELVSEIESEERRLVDLIEEEDQKKTEQLIESAVNLSSDLQNVLDSETRSKTEIYTTTNGLYSQDETFKVETEINKEDQEQIEIKTDDANPAEEIIETALTEYKTESVEESPSYNKNEDTSNLNEEATDSQSDIEVISVEGFESNLLTNQTEDNFLGDETENNPVIEQSVEESYSEVKTESYQKIFSEEKTEGSKVEEPEIDTKDIFNSIEVVENYYSQVQTVDNEEPSVTIDNKTSLDFSSFEEIKSHTSRVENYEEETSGSIKIFSEDQGVEIREDTEGVSLISSEFLKEEKDEDIFEELQTAEDQKSDILEVKEGTVEETKTDSKPFRMSSGIQIRVLTLNDKEHQDSVLYRLQKNWILQFRLGPSLMGRRVSLFCNYPEENEAFKRNIYNLLKWRQDEGCNHSDDTVLLIEITVKIAGSFHYYFTYEDSDPEEHQGSGFFLVDPVLKYGNNDELPLDCVQCQTVLAKGLGPFDTWESKLKVGKESGYNVIHFTPIQKLGASNSSYSLSEQLKVNPIFTKQNGDETTFDDIANLIKKIRTEWKVASICDIVLNHTANESEWLKEHPEVTYNCQNCPYMRPAYLLDAFLHQFSIDVSKGFYEDKGIPEQVSTEEHLNAIRYYLHCDVLAKAKIYELYICDVSNYVSEFLHLVRNKIPPTRLNSNSDEELTLIQDPFYRRLGSTVDLNLAVKLYNVFRNDSFDEETRIKKCAEDFKNKIESLNQKVIDEVEEHLKAAVENVIAGIRYFRVQHDGPKLRDITIKKPLISRYFTDYGTPANAKEHEDVMYSDNGKFLMAHNGWVMNSDPLRNFAAPGSNVYIRRELIAWGDSVKLRYGERPEDCPFLWEYMGAYVEKTAEIFDGVRLDNCHSTPIPVAEYLLDRARRIRPNLYVVAELFTNSDLTDNIFVNRLGITSLIREAMSAWDSHEQGRLVYRYGGSPVGSFYQSRVRPLVPSIAHALFLDLTHDNPSPIEKRSVFDLLPSTALVSMACCASGSTRGYNELVPHHIHVVDETRQYAEWSEDEKLAAGNSRYVTRKSGIIAAKRALNDLHFHLGNEGFSQVYVDQMDPDVVAVTRHCPETHESYVLVAFTAFSHPPEDAAHHQRGIRPLRVEGVLDEIVLEATLEHVSAKSSGSKYAKSQNFYKDTKWINGLSEYQVHINEHIQPENSEIFEKVDSGAPNLIQLNFKNFKPGSIAVIKVSLPEDMKSAVANVRQLISRFSVKKGTELWGIISQMALPDLNRALYRCGQEERDEGYGFDTYNIPNFGPTVYAGFQGFMSLLSVIRPNNDLGHPMCANLRDGNWMIDYIWQRLKLDEGTKQLGQWFEENTKSLKAIPRYLIPCYFDVIVTGIYILLIEQSYDLMSDFVKKGSTFVRGLALGSVQMAAYIKSADLPVLSPNLAEPKPAQKKSDQGENVQSCVTLSAGLPHFSVGYMRNWGRDTFIALRGLFLLTGRYQDARYHILGYAACLRHGLIPNLLDGGRNSRFNCRDAVWWWLYCIKCYTEDAPDGLAILADKVSRIFPTDDSPAQSPGTHDQALRDVIQEALNVHFQGMVFRERNAGRQIDEHMTDQGFNNQIGIHPETGFVFGGNVFNCGTWMDKMGSSDKAGNRGKPATPRDGSAVELVGLSKAAVTWLHKLHQEGIYPYDGVERTGKNGVVTKWTFKEWANKIQTNFETYFWVNATPAEGEIRPDLINKRGIYKDCHGATQEWTDFQLRCNFPIAMVAAPELFDPKRAWTALSQAEKYLLGPLGMRTLDPEDWAYNGFYDNSNDSNDFNVAHGLNYHQGPEWVWPVGFYLRAKLRFAEANGKLASTVNSTKVVLSRHFVELQTSTWRGLPELTNKDGAYCKDSSRTQAWSMSCILEYDAFDEQVRYFGDLLSRVSLKQEPKRQPLSSSVDFDEISPVDDDNPRITDELFANQVEKPLLDDRLNPIVLEPLSLEAVHKKRIINRIYETEQRKLVRITIMYTLAFFALAITTFFIIYLA